MNKFIMIALYCFIIQGLFCMDFDKKLVPTEKFPDEIMEEILENIFLDCENLREVGQQIIKIAFVDRDFKRLILDTVLLRKTIEQFALGRKIEDNSAFIKKNQSESVKNFVNLLESLIKEQKMNYPEIEEFIAKIRGLLTK